MASRRHARRGPFADGPTGIPDPIAGPDGRRRRGPPAAPVEQLANPAPGDLSVTTRSGASRARGPRARTSALRSIATPPSPSYSQDVATGAHLTCPILRAP